MECIGCGNDVEEFFSEEIECSSCGDVMVIGYYCCEECDTAWKTLDGVLAFSVDLDNAEFLEDIPTLLDGIEEEIVRKEEANSMRKFIHKCIRCGSLSYEIAEDTYKCTECDFEWEVIRCE